MKHIEGQPQSCPRKGQAQHGRTTRLDYNGRCSFCGTQLTGRGMAGTLGRDPVRAEYGPFRRDDV